MQRASIIFIALTAFLVVSCGGEGGARSAPRVTTSADDSVRTPQTYLRDAVVDGMNGLPDHLLDQPVSIGGQFDKTAGVEACVLSGLSFENRAVELFRVLPPLCTCLRS